MTRASLHLVPDQPEPQPDLSYEASTRRHIMSRDWAAVHVASDRREPIALSGQANRTWRA